MKSILAIGELGSMTNVYKVYLPSLSSIENLHMATFKGVFGVHDGWERLHQDEHWKGGSQCHPSSWTCHVQGYQVTLWNGKTKRDFLWTGSSKRMYIVECFVWYYLKRFLLDREYQEATGFRVGFKPAGGIRTAKDAIAWLVLIKVCMLCLCICFVILFVYLYCWRDNDWLTLGGTWGLLAEQQNV